MQAGFPLSRRVAALCGPLILILSAPPLETETESWKLSPGRSCFVFVWACGEGGEEKDEESEFFSKFSSTLVVLNSLLLLFSFFFSSSSFSPLPFSSHRVERVAVEELIGRDRVGQHVELEDHQREGGVGLKFFLFLFFIFFVCFLRKRKESRGERVFGRKNWAQKKKPKSSLSPPTNSPRGPRTTGPAWRASPRAPRRSAPRA